MKKSLLMLCLLTTPAMAGSADAIEANADLEARYLVETGQLRLALGQALTEVVRLKKRLSSIEEKSKEDIK